jgi:uncharacterized protein YecE (DUF72 family)
MRKTGSASKTRLRVHRRLAKISKEKRSGELHIGISGWRYPGWRGKFYPKRLPHRRELEYASGAFNSVEINGSFYSLQRPSSYERRYSEAPDEFLFAVKGGRFITHMKKLRDVEELYVSGYNDKTLGWWANRIEHWRKGKQPRDAKLITRPRKAAKRLDVFVYFDNAPKSMRLSTRNGSQRNLAFKMAVFSSNPTEIISLARLSPSRAYSASSQNL